MFAAEPETAAPLARSLARGEPGPFEGWTASFVDGAGGRSVLPTMWPLLQPMVDDSIVVSLDEVKAAMKRTAERVHVIAEGAAGCAVAAALSGRVPGRKIVAIVSGGNIDLTDEFLLPLRNLVHQWNVSHWPLRFPAVFIVFTNCPSTCGGVGLRPHVRFFAASTIPCGGNRRTTRSECS